ncbi:SDR family oxidoreductase [Streptomyces sp. NPDC060194]|uniref:SDR family oxidoreductase n=1 Tax=Streptomyces sp. NPDC060194 TaxID=3347069 RepID=UPI003646B2D5
MSRYKDRKAVVIGGTTGIGLAVAKRLAEGGARVLVTGRSEANLDQAAKELGPTAHPVVSDLADLASVRALAPAVEDRLGSVDHLFVNAGIAFLAPTEHVTEADYDRQFAVNTKGAYFTVQALLPLLADGGSIVFTTSVADTTGTPAMGVYSMSKAALWSFAQALAAELAGRGIRVNAVAPGFIDTPGGGVQRLSPEEHAAFAEAGDALTPLGRHGTADEVARAAVFLAVDATFTTGTKLAVDGGLAQQIPAPER